LFDALLGTATRAAGAPAVADQGVACFRVVLEVLGLPAAGGCLQRLLQLFTGIDQSVGHGNLTTQLLWVLHSSWLEGLQPLLQVRQQVVHPLQEVPAAAPCWQQQQQQHADGWRESAGAQDVHSSAHAGMLRSTQMPALSPDPEQLALAAAGAGQSGEFVQHLEQLTGLRPDRACEVLSEVATAQGGGRSPGVVRLCEVLLAAWLAARQTAAASAAQEQVEAVLGAVMLWKQQQGLA
jgi:hypothetical protein